jgi:putative nucleotidyltransferase with HDIG domain
MAEINIPNKQQCLDILAKNKTPPNVVSHCKSVCEIAEGIADKLIIKGKVINKKLVIAAALLHDIERDKKNHVDVGADLVKSMGFPEVAEVMRKHSLKDIEYEKNQPSSYEEKIVFYADKRVMNDKIVSLRKRFADLKERYEGDFTKEMGFAEKIEHELVD